MTRRSLFTCQLKNLQLLIATVTKTFHINIIPKPREFLSLQNIDAGILLLLATDTKLLLAKLLITEFLITKFLITNLLQSF